RTRDEHDRRRSVVRTTAKGRRLLARADALAARIEDELLGHLDAGQRARLHEVLREAFEGTWSSNAAAAGEAAAWRGGKRARSARGARSAAGPAPREAPAPRRAPLRERRPLRAGPPAPPEAPAPRGAPTPREVLPRSQ